MAAHGPKVSFILQAVQYSMSQTSPAQYYCQQDTAKHYYYSLENFNCVLLTKTKLTESIMQAKPVAKMKINREEK